MAQEVIQKDLGIVTAYGYALAGGYQGTEAQFETAFAALLSGQYNQLSNKPSINGVSLVGNKTTAQLGIEMPLETHSDGSMAHNPFVCDVADEVNYCLFNYGAVSFLGFRILTNSDFTISNDNSYVLCTADGTDPDSGGLVSQGLMLKFTPNNYASPPYLERPVSINGYSMWGHMGQNHPLKYTEPVYWGEVDYYDSLPTGKTTLQIFNNSGAAVTVPSGTTINIDAIFMNCVGSN